MYSLRSQSTIVVARMRMRLTTPVLSPRRDHVADADRALEQQDDAGDEVREDFLQAESEADAHRGDEPLDLAQSNPDGVERGCEAERRRARSATCW